MSNIILFLLFQDHQLTIVKESVIDIIKEEMLYKIDLEINKILEIQMITFIIEDKDHYQIIINKHAKKRMLNSIRLFHINK